MQKWEYLYAEGPQEFGISQINGEVGGEITPVVDFLQAKGDEGWELVSATSIKVNDHDWITLYFKRPKS